MIIDNPEPHWERTQHTFEPQMHGIAHYTCSHLRRYADWSGREWASKTGPSFDLGGRETIYRYETVNES